MLNCWEAALGAAVSVPVLLFVAAPYIRCVLPSAAPALRVCPGPQSAPLGRGAGALRVSALACVAGVRTAGIPSYSPRRVGSYSGPPSASAPVTVTGCRARSALAPPGAFPGLCPGTGRSRRSGRGRGPRSPQGAAVQPIGRKAPGRAVAANGSCGST